MMLNTFCKETIDTLEQKKLKRQLRCLDNAQGPKIILDGREVLNFCSNNYLGLANDERLINAAKQSLDTGGFGSGASRLVCGNMSAHEQLEEKLATFKGTEAALVFSTGYMANVGIISSLFNRDDCIFSDRLNHASIIDGIRLSQADFKRYPHNDMGALEEMLKKSQGHRQRIIITDSVFSMDGDIAPLDKIVSLAKKYDCLTMIDEAHGLGVMGEKGKGVVEHFGLENQIDIQMGTLSKAAGSFGAYCCGSREFITYLTNKARSFIYTTAMPPSVAAASTCAISIIENESSLRDQLWNNTYYMHQRLKEMGFNILNTQTPIVPIIIGDNDKTVLFSQKLLEEGIFVSAIRPPTVPHNTARLRLTVMASHTGEDLKFVLEQLERIGKNLNVI